jgi:hypothetical protein
MKGGPNFVPRLPWVSKFFPEPRAREGKVFAPEIGGGVVLHGTLGRWSAKAAEGDRSFRRPKRVESLCRDSPPKYRTEGERPWAAESVAQATRITPESLAA